jgi:hypothetical protein
LFPEIYQLIFWRTGWICSTRRAGSQGREENIYV